MTAYSCRKSVVVVFSWCGLRTTACHGTYIYYIIYNIVRYHFRAVVSHLTPPCEHSWRHDCSGVVCCHLAHLMPLERRFNFQSLIDSITFFVFVIIYTVLYIIDYRGVTFLDSTRQV
jgi:hypothetical protein